MLVYTVTNLEKLKFRIATSTLRTVEKNGGIDSFLVNSFSKTFQVAQKV